MSIFKQKEMNVGKSDFYTVVAVDTEHKLFKLASMTAGNRNTFQLETVPYKARVFDDEFFNNFARVLENYSKKHPTAQNAPTTVIIPNSTFSTDVISMPTMKKSKIDQALDIRIRDLYKSSEALKINRSVIMQNKQYTVFSVAMANQDILTKIYACSARCKMTPRNVTFPANSAVNALVNVNQKLKNATFVFMNIGFEGTCFSLVNKGRTAGFFELPFGYEILQKSRLAAENILFDQPESELLVLNAIEKAKTKNLTMMQADSNATMTGEALKAQYDDDDEEDEELVEEAPQGDSVLDDGEPYESVLQASVPGQSIKVLPKKQPRKLPKYMLRPQPSGEHEYGYENFRLFIKWALNLIQSNKSLLGEPVSTVYVNMPKELDYLFEMTNAEAEENGVKFETIGEYGIKQELLESFDIFGGFYDSAQNSNNNF